jgi:putative aminopeptidase FrvX
MTDAELLALAQTLIRIPSPPGDEHDVVDATLRAMKDAGFDGFWRDEVGNAVGVVIGAEPGPDAAL